MIEFGEVIFPGSVPWENTDEEYPDVQYCLEQLYAQMLGWA